MSVFEATRQRQIALKGRPATLRRGNTDYAVLAFFVQWRPEQITGTDLRQGDVRIELLADLGGCPAPPRDPDMVIAANAAYTILYANPVYDGTVLIGWSAAARGA